MTGGVAGRFHPGGGKRSSRAALLGRASGTRSVEAPLSRSAYSRRLGAGTARRKLSRKLIFSHATDTLPRGDAFCADEPPCLTLFKLLW
jgi:hypothetical protein